VHRYEPVIGHRERGGFRIGAYVVVEREQELEEKWTLITSGNPDFLKAYLVHSEDFPARQGDGYLNGRTGLNPALLPRIVAKGPCGWFAGYRACRVGIGLQSCGAGRGG